MEKLKILLLQKNLKVLCYFSGHSTISKNSSEEKNPYCFVQDLDNPDEPSFYVMYCEPGILTYISEEDIFKLLYKKNGSKETWTLLKKQNLIGSTKIKEKNKITLMHHRIMDVEDDVDRVVIHLNSNNLDNRRNNLIVKKIENDTRKYLEKMLEWLKENRNLDRMPTYLGIRFRKNKLYFYISHYHPILKKKGCRTGIYSNKFFTLEEMIYMYIQMEKGFYFLDSVKNMNTSEWSMNHLKRYICN